MDKHQFRFTGRYILLPACAGAICAIGWNAGSMPASAAAVALFDDEEEAPATLNLTGVVRDFHERTHSSGHPDMERQPNAGFGLYSGNVALQLGADRKPIFTGQGAKVLDQFRAASGHAIAPHLFNKRFECQYEMPLNDCVTVEHASPGPGGMSRYQVCFLGVDFNTDGTSTWRYSIEKVAGSDLSHWTLWLDPEANIMDGTTEGWEWIGDDHPNFPGPGIKWNMGGGVSPGEFVVVLDKQYFGKNDSWVQAKGGGGTTYGIAPFFGPSSKISDTGLPYEYTWTLVEDPDMGDQPGEFGTADSGGITSAESFNQWFRDVPGVNVSMPLSLTLHRQSDGMYVFDDTLDERYASLGGFFPIEDQLLGNPGGWPNRNFHFTFEMHTTFTYDEDGAQFFRFIGDDDVWVFIDNQLVIDLGGVHAALEQHVDLNRLCMEHGKTYRLSFFFAERHRTQSNFRIETNIPLKTGNAPSVTAAFD